MVSKVAYEFGGYRFEPMNLRLVYGETVIPLTVKAADTLTVLVQHPDVVVPKEELMAAVWPDAVVEENNLNQHISALRRALSHNGTGSFIETVPRRGYRFVGSVKVVPVSPPDVEPVDAIESGLAASAQGEPKPQAGSPARVAFWTRRRAVAGVLFLLVGVMVAAGTRWYQGRAGLRTSNQARELGDQLRTRGDIRGAMAEYERAIRLNPRNAMAHSGVAHALNRLSNQDSVRRPAGASPSVAAAMRGVDADPRCADCQGTLGLFLFYHEWEWSRAESHLREGLRLAPDKHGMLPALAMLLAATGRLDDALAQIDRALARQPNQITPRVMRATFLYLQRRYPEAVAAADHALSIDDGERTAWEWRSRALFQMGRDVEAVHALARSAFADHAQRLEQAAREDGGPGALRLLLDVTSDWHGRVQQSWRRGPWRLLLGDYAGALDELERAYEYRNVNLLYIATDPVYDPIRNEPRFRRILAGMGLDEVQAAPAVLTR